jgi:putative ABC transport system permease protein
MDALDHSRLRGSSLADLLLIHRLALADYFHDRRLTFSLIISLAAMLAPLLVLFGLRLGIIAGMTEELSQDPRSRELRPLGQGQFSAAWLDELRSRDDVAFVLPATRFLAATITLRNPARMEGEPVHAELRPSAPGDPLLEGSEARPDGFTSIVLSRPAAESLGVGEGERLQARISRTRMDGKRESVRLSLRVDAVLPAGKTQRVEALVGLPFLLAAEDYREGFAVGELDAEGPPRPRGERTFASFRLYARSIYDVARLREWLAARGVRTDTRLAEIELVQRLDRGLGVLFLVVAGLGATGYVIALMVSLWANTERKRRELSVLRLVGLHSSALALFPVVQSMVTGLLGAAIASALYLPVDRLINHLFRDSLASHQVLTRLEPRHFLLAAGVTLAFALLASIAAGARAAKISPAEGLRDE